MSEWTEEMRELYREQRIADQLHFYSARRTLFDRASGQALAVAAILLGGATAAGAIAGTNVEPAWLWSLLAAVLPAAATAMAGYSTLYAFDQQAKIYADAVRALRAAARRLRDPSGAQEEVGEWVARVEDVFRREQAQWGQLTSQSPLGEDPKAGAL